MQPLNGFLMLKKQPKAEAKSGIIIPDSATEEPVKSTGFLVLKVAKDVEGIKEGDIVFPGYIDEVRSINGFIFCKATHLVAKE